MKSEISLNDNRYFNLSIGKRVLQSEIFDSKGHIPVYSANVFKPFGYLDKSNIRDFSHNYILWGIDGDFKFNIMKRRSVFATTDHCGIIAILNQAIMPEYLLFVLELQSRLLGFDRTLRPSLAQMRKVIVKIPIDKDGNFDYLAQNLIVQKYRALKEIKEKIATEINELSKATFNVELPKETITLKVEDIFDLAQTTNRSSFTKAFVNSHKGDIPVYSASKNPDDVGYGFIKDGLQNVKYFENILTWNIDGSVGKAFLRKGRFSLSEKAIPLVLKKKWEGLVDYTYVKYLLEQRVLELGFAYSNKAGKSRIRDIGIDLPPKRMNNADVLPDINKQKEIVDKYNQAYVTKDSLIQYLQDLKNISVEI